MPTLSKPEFDAVLAEVIDKAPEGLDESAFNTLLSQAVEQAEAARAPMPTMASTELGMSAEEHQDAMSRADEVLPEVGGIIGGVGGVPGAVVGGQLGKLGQDLIRANRGDPRTPTTSAEAFTANVGEGLKQGAYQKGGDLVGQGVVKVGGAIAGRAEPLIRSALKPTVTAMKQQAGASRSGIDAQVKRMIGVLKRERLATPDAAEEAIKGVERDIQDTLTKVGPDAEEVTRLTDVGERSQRYLGKLEKSAKHQVAKTEDPGQVRAAQRDLEEGELFQTVEDTARRTPPKMEDGGYVIDPSREVPTMRVPRANVTVGETLTRARGTDKFQNRRAYGEMKGTPTEASKTLSRAARDSAKASAPELAPALRRQGELIKSRELLDRMQFREGNTDPVDIVTGALVGGGNIPLGVLHRLLKTNKLRAGYAADDIGRLLKQAGVQVAPNVAAALARMINSGAGSPMASHEP